MLSTVATVSRYKDSKESSPLTQVDKTVSYKSKSAAYGECLGACGRENGGWGGDPRYSQFMYRYANIGYSLRILLSSHPSQWTPSLLILLSSTSVILPHRFYLHCQSFQPNSYGCFKFCLIVQSVQCFSLYLWPFSSRLCSLLCSPPPLLPVTSVFASHT